MKYLLLLLPFLSCTGAQQKPAVSFSTERLDTLLTTPAVLSASPAIFETAFIKGTTQKENDALFRLFGITIGHIKTNSGHIIACDPMHIDEYGIPFTQQFPRGSFPVELSIAKLEAEETIAFARIRFSDAPVARWEFALRADQQPAPVMGKRMEGFSVDGGVGIYVDEAAAKLVDQSKLASFDREMFQEMNKHYHNDWRYTIYPFGANNLAAFSTGLGDGNYSTYIGFDAAGNPCRLLTDMGIFNWRRKG